MSHSSRNWVDRTIPNWGTSDRRRRSSQSLVYIFKMLLRFETRTPQGPNFSLLTPSTTKIKGGMGEIFESIFRAIICNHRCMFRFPALCSISKPECFKSDCGRKLRPNFTLFTVCKIRRGVSEMSEWIFSCDPTTDILLTERRWTVSEIR